MEAVATKQGFETPMIKEMIHKFRVYENHFPGDAEVELATVVLRNKLIEKDDALYDGVKDKVVPVRHTITVREVAAE
jgi:hypothetical protein